MRFIPRRKIGLVIAFFLIIIFPCLSQSRDLAEVKASGVLRHLAVPYANFVVEYKVGDQIFHSDLDIELIKGFAQYLGVKYQFVSASLGSAWGELSGVNGQFVNGVDQGACQEIKSDVIAHGVMMLDWRKQFVDFSDGYFPSAVWLVARRESDLQPITPSNSIHSDIKAINELLGHKSVLVMAQFCLDPALYGLEQTQATIIVPQKVLKINEMVPAILNNEAETMLLAVADSLHALGKWPHQLNVIGPISTQQSVAAAFSKKSPQLLQVFNHCLASIKANGRYIKLIKKYSPSVFYYYQDYFSAQLRS